MKDRVSALGPDGGLTAGAATPGDEPQEIVLAVVGEGPLVVNVDGPTP